MKMNPRCSFIILVLLASSITGEEESDVKPLDSSTADGLEEVSIESVDYSGGRPPQFYTNRNFFEIFRSENSNSARVLPSTDTSTAVATVYPDFDDGVSGDSNNSSTKAGNGTAGGGRFLRVRVTCQDLIPQEDNQTFAFPEVEIVNMTHLLHTVLYSNPTVKTRATPSNCTIVFFYTYWCPWSAKAAPHFNSLPRAFKNIRFVAIDSSIHTPVNTYFGILSVPSIVLFFNGKILAKFNDTTFNVNQFSDFITTFTDQKPGARLNVTSGDFVGPIPSVSQKSSDFYLYVSWAFIIACFLYYMSKTTTFHRLLELIQNSWREDEAVSSSPPDHHFHQD